MAYNSSSVMNEDLMRMHRTSHHQDFRREALWYWLKNHIQTGRVLDAGGGSGYMTIRLLQSGHEVVLAEPDRELLTFAEQRAVELGVAQNFTGIQKPLEELTADDLSTFDTIMCLDVLEHIDDDSSALARLVTLLADDGVMIITVPAIPMLYGTRDIQYGHYRRHNKQTLRKLVEDSGLRVETIKYWNLLGVFPYFLYEKVLHKPINDSLRQKKGSKLTATIRRSLAGWLKLETHLPPPFGLSLLCIAHQ